MVLQIRRSKLQTTQIPPNNKDETYEPNTEKTEADEINEKKFKDLGISNLVISSSIHYTNIMNERLKKESTNGEISTRKAREIALEVWDNYYIGKKIVTGIGLRSRKDIDTKFEHLYSILSREDFIYQAIINLKNNKGINTPGVDKKTLDSMSSIDVLKLSKKIKNNEFLFKPVKRVMIPKPDKKEERPLGIPTFEDRIVQEMIRIILEAIYEPIFEKKNKDSNYGFRPNKSCQMAIDKLRNTAQNTEWCIEGDIKGAYNNVNHDTLIKILKEKIEDREVINLINQGLKCGCIHSGSYEHTLIGTPQGGIASPILFNIYMSKLDDFIHTEINNKIEEWNITENRKTKPVTKTYRKYESTATSSKFVIKRIKEKEKNLGNTLFKNWTSESKEKYLEFRIKKKNALKETKKSPYLDKKNALIRYSYIRYADDWVFFSNCSKERIEEIKTMIAEFLGKELALTLSEKKTKITNVKKDKVKFLGFTLSYFAKNLKMSTIKKESNITKFGWTSLRKTPTIQHKRRTTGNQLLIGIDQDRLESRLDSKRFINKKKIKGTRKAEWTVLGDYEIIMRYNYVIRGLVTYYSRSIRDFSILNKYIYLLNYSCAHTLANKHRSSLRKIFIKYGNPIQVTQDPDNKKEKKVIKLLNYQACKDFAKQLNDKDADNDNDFLQIRINWRTTYKLNKHCVICGSTNKVQMHHIKHVRKDGKALEGFGKIIAILNRKQICVCHTCHRRIHLGLYDGYNLSDLYDPQLATI